MQHLLQQVHRADLLLSGALERRLHGLADFIEQLLARLEGHAAEDDLGLAHRLPVLLGDRHHNDEDPVGREHAAVAQRDVGHLADLDAVDEDHPRALALAEAGAAPVDLERQAVLGLKDVLDRHPDGLRELRVHPQPLEVAVEGHHVARLEQVQHQLDLFGVPVAGGVHGRLARRDDLAADVVEAVDGVVHGALVARDRGGREHDGVAFAKLDQRVVAVGHAP